MSFRNAVRVALCLLGALVAGNAQVAPADQRLQRPDPKDWLTYHGRYDGQRHSALKQITPANINRLQVRWVFALAGAAAEGQSVPLVMDGVMYIHQFDRVDALDARTGNIIWQYRRAPVSNARQRGGAVYGDKVFVVTSDGHLVALDARTGGVRWEAKVAEGQTISGAAPLVANGKLLVSGRSFVQAYDTETGKHIWTWTPLPTPEDPAYKTWGNSKPTGGNMWITGTFDPELDLLYYGTGEPQPSWQGLGRPGDNLYTDCIVALNIETGKMVWYFQNTPHDVHDWDSSEVPVLVDGNFKGRPRKLLLQANRNGYYYILDRTTGEFLQGTQFIPKLDWAAGLDEKGRPIVVPGHEPTVHGTKTCPSTMGATNWPSPTYDPANRYFITYTADGCSLLFLTSSTNPESGTGYIESQEDPWQAHVRAYDAFTGKKVWEYQASRSNHYGPGLVSTAGGIVFVPEQFGQVTVLDTKTGKPLWHFNTGNQITASPIVYSVDGQQFFAVTSGTNVFAFGLPEVQP